MTTRTRAVVAFDVRHWITFEADLSTAERAVLDDADSDEKLLAAVRALHTAGRLKVETEDVDDQPYAFDPDARPNVITVEDADFCNHDAVAVVDGVCECGQRVTPADIPADAQQQLAGWVRDGLPEGWQLITGASTGGGCLAWIVDADDGRQLMLTDLGFGDQEPWHTPGTGIALGYYTEGGEQNGYLSLPPEDCSQPGITEAIRAWAAGDPWLDA